MFQYFYIDIIYTAVVHDANAKDKDHFVNGQKMI